MSGYGYAPPPPPPPPSASHGRQSYGQAGSYQHGQGRGASNGRGRGGHYPGGVGRGDYRSSGPSHYEYPPQAYPAHGAPSYPPAGAYPQQPQHWSPEGGHAHPPPQPHAPAPISSANYHPNYAPQPYPLSQYPQHASYGPSYAPPAQYSHPYAAPPPPPPSQWNGQGPSPQPPYGPGRHRGGHSDRGSSRQHSTGPPVRHGYEHDPAVRGGYGQPYSHELQPQYPYGAPPPPSGPPRHASNYHGQTPRRGRGGGHGDGKSRGRGGHHNHDRQKYPQSKPNQNDRGNGVKAEPPSAGRKKKRKMNTLGLTPGQESESEEDEEEEKMLGSMLDADAYEVLNDAAAAASFIADRKKNFPTKARTEARKAELAKTNEVKREDRRDDKASALEKQAIKLRKQLRKVESSIKRKREQGDEGDDMRQSDSGDSSEDEKPQVMSSRKQDNGKKADITKHCKYFSTGGTCGKKGKCRFVHDNEVREAALRDREANDGRLTIQQRLILNDKEQEDLTVLQSIQYLREKGLMPQSAPAVVGKEEKEKATSPQPVSAAEPATTTSLLPAAPPSLPPPPIKREAGSSRRNPPPSTTPSAHGASAPGSKHYQGWLLKPYGSASGEQPSSEIPDNQP
ncbi:hypothetical protein S7711_04036 [Stachybotrys chartarum IBT 7711]|uniref:C3H1-type domain-containing protein n=1 Tax=Stachybotrys chartarum (strain CBS 109288 / IBT 7711) TaxID=1280523 RepID=A0A084AXJ2_STACB|nr:hypothetical protein S7711_04036 [Stachybotrys chartarum IBT 7711]